MGNRFLNYAAISAFGIHEWMDKALEIMGRQAPHDTSAKRKARKERARELTRQREQDLRERKKK